VRTVRLPEAPQANSPFWWIWERFTDVHMATYKATRGRIGGTYGKAPVALVDSIGRKSGKRRTHPLLATRDGENIVVVASKGGVDKHPAWYHNLMANPDTTIQIGSERRSVHARLADPEERERLWPEAVKVWSGYADYQARSKGREIPMVVLEPRG
jgi:F420H(2)-dependent quinone reductase